MITIQKYWKRWSDPRCIILVLNNRDLNQVSWEMRIESGEPKYDASQTLPNFPYARYAEMLGFVGVKIAEDDEVGAAWDTVLHADRPALLEAWVHPSLSIIPPHITFEQARNFTSALAQGDPDQANIIVNSAKGVLAGMLPSKRHP